MKRSPLVVSVLVFLGVSASAQSPELFERIRGGDVPAVKSMVEKDGSLVRARDPLGNTPLHAAAIAGSVPLVDWLLSKNADIDAENQASMTALVEAIGNQRDDVALLLIDKGADIGKGGGALARAAMRNRLAVAERLIAKGADIEQKRGEYTPLGLIARGGLRSFEVFELLVRKGADFNLRDSLGNTPLDNAVIYGGDGRIIDLLLGRSAEINGDPAALKTTMAAAAERGHARLFDYYRGRGGEALLADEANGRMFMRRAILGRSLELVKSLRARGLPLDLGPDAGGSTPLHGLASDPGALEMIEFLVRSGADIDARTSDGRSAYNIAESSGNRDGAALLARLGASTAPQKFPALTGPYLGQAPPGDEPRPFAPGIVRLDHGTVAFSPDGREAYWPTGTAIMMSRVRDGRWTQPAYAPFSGPREIAFYDDVPFVAPDNKRLFFTSRRPVGSEASQKENIWFVERTADGWSEPRPVDSPVNAMMLHWQVSVAKTGTLYFSGQSDKDSYGSTDLYCSRLVAGRYTAPVNLGPAINTDRSESQPFVAPDESYILFYAAAGQVPSLYVSFRGKSGEWSPAVKLDHPWMGGGLIVTPDGKYLFAGGYWRSARFIDDLRR